MVKVYSFDFAQNKKNIYVNYMRILLIWASIKEYKRWDQVFDNINIFFNEHKVPKNERINFYTSLYKIDITKNVKKQIEEIENNDKLKNEFISNFILSANYYSEYVDNFLINLDLQVPYCSYLTNKNEGRITFYTCSQCGALVSVEKQYDNIPVICPNCVPFIKDKYPIHTWFLPNTKEYENMSDWIKEEKFCLHHPILHKIKNVFIKNKVKLTI
jgi:hypothetical protein